MQIKYARNWLDNGQIIYLLNYELGCLLEILQVRANQSSAYLHQSWLAYIYLFKLESYLI